MVNMETVLQSYIADKSALGFAVAVLQDGEPTYVGGFGKTTVAEHGTAITPNTLFAYGSISKMLCATLVMRLVDGGLLALDRPVVDYLPGFAFSDPGRGNKVTLRHLLSHTSGLPMSGKYWGPRDPDSLRRFVYEQIPRYTFHSEPGEVFLYSNTVICMAGYAVEAVTGQYYDDLMQTYVFDPLQMTTTFDPAEVMMRPLALPHRVDPAGNVTPAPKMPYNVSGNPSSFAYGTAQDLANIAQMYLNGGQFNGQTFLTSASIQEMHTMIGRGHTECHIHPLSQCNIGYGLGFNVGHYKGHRNARHGGLNLSNNCFFDLFPDDNAGFILMVNYCYDHIRLMELVSYLADYALGLPYEGVVYRERPQTTPSQLDLRRYEGAFMSFTYGSLVNIGVQAGKLYLEEDGKQYEMVQWGRDVFYIDVTETFIQAVEFFFDPAGTLTHIMKSGEPLHPIELLPFKSDIATWRSFAGAYRDPSNWELNDIIYVRFGDDQLLFKEGIEGKEAPGRAITPDTFLTHLGYLQFQEHNGQTVLIVGQAAYYFPLAE